MPEQIIRYRCIHCLKKAYASKYDAIKHERRCFFNPDSRSCVTCENATTKVIYDSDDCIEDIKDWCNETNREIYLKGYPIKHCSSWKQKECPEEYEE